MCMPLGLHVWGSGCSIELAPLRSWLQPGSSCSCALHSLGSELGGNAGYRLREATLLFQQGQEETASRLLRGVVRKHPTYAGETGCP